MRNRDQRTRDGAAGRVGLGCQERGCTDKCRRVGSLSLISCIMRRELPCDGMVSTVRRQRSGLSLAELVAVVAIAAVVGSAIIATVTRQQRFYRGAAELHYLRENVRDAMEVLSTDIRGMSVADTVRLHADSAIEFFATIGSSVVCQTVGNEVGLPTGHSSANSLTAFEALPDSGDLAVFYTHLGNGAEDWEPHRIAGFASRSLALSCPGSSGLSRQSELDSEGTGFVVTLVSPLRDGVRAGTPVRFVRRGRYSLYRASDGDWYLGYRRCNAVGASTCGVIQPVSGSYRAYSSDPRASGLLFEYFDATGQRLGALASPLALARVDITARSESTEQAVLGARPSTISDSATVSVAIRNGAR
jgi:hypothetical protein